jgi:ethanolamine utilization protein
MDQEQLIRVVTAEVLRQLSGGPQNQELSDTKSIVRVLAIFTGGTIGLEPSLTELQQLQKIGFKLSVVLSRAAEKVIGIDLIKEKLGSNILIIDSQLAHPGQLLGETDLVLVPVLTQNMAAKLAHTISDTLVTTLVMQALMMGKPVIAAQNAADPQASWRIEANMGKSSTGLLQSLRSNLDKLTAYGIKLVQVTALGAASQKLLEQSIKKVVISEQVSEKSPVKNKKTIIGATAVKAVIAKGLKQLTLSQGTIVTPLARDVARDLGVEIVEE